MRLTEDVIYIAIAVALVAEALGLLVSAGSSFLCALTTGLLVTSVLLLMDRLLIVMLVEILHTVGISLRQHVLSSEPFLIVGLIAVIRRVLIITAEQSQLIENANPIKQMLFTQTPFELLLLGFLILILVVSIYLLRCAKLE